MRILQCKLTTIEAMLGTASNNKELHSEFIASHAPDAPSREEEIAAVGVDEVIEKGKTEICDLDCFRCKYRDCINDETLTRQNRYYWRNRDRLLAEKREKYKKRKAETKGD